MKECYVKCASNEQAQALRPYLVEFGFVDDVAWNDCQTEYRNTCIDLGGVMGFDIYGQATVNTWNVPMLYDMPADADLAEAAKTIKELFDKL